MDIEQYIEDQLHNIDIRAIVIGIVRDQAKSEVYATIKRLTEQEISTIIKKEIEIALSQSLETDDGWGKREKYDSFEDIFRKVFAEKLAASYEVKKTIKKMVEDKVGKLYEQNKQEAIKKVVTELTKE